MKTDVHKSHVTHPRPHSLWVAELNCTQVIWALLLFQYLSHCTTVPLIIICYIFFYIAKVLLIPLELVSLSKGTVISGNVIKKSHGNWSGWILLAISHQWSSLTNQLFFFNHSLRAIIRGMTYLTMEILDSFALTLLVVCMYVFNSIFDPNCYNYICL